MMKKLLFLIINLILLLACKKEEKQFSYIFPDKWAFLPGDSIHWAQADYNDLNWPLISTRQYWELQGYSDYDGFAWYRTNCSIDSEWKPVIDEAGGLIIRYDKADDVDEIYFNGQKAGQTGEFHPNYEGRYDAKRKYRIPAEWVKYDYPNTIAIRLYDDGGNGGIHSEEIIIHSISPLENMNFIVDAVDDDWVFTDTKNITLDVSLENTLEKDVRFNLICKITTDDYRPIDSLSLPVKGKKGENIQQSIHVQPLTSGFYRITLYAEKDGFKSDEKKFNIGINPEEIISPQDKKNDFDNFWSTTRSELDKIAPRYKLTLLKGKSSDRKNMYHVEMYSFGNVKIEGYYAVPVQEGKYPVIVAYMGYGSDPYFPDVNGMPDFCEFVLSVRGQGIQKATNTYGEWITYGLQNKETYYYRGAFMDLIRALDFVSSRPEIDNTKIVAEGGSQGGAFTLAACALDKRIKAAAPYIPFLSDFRDYFRICPWPRELFEVYLHGNPEADWEDIYDVLSYFDIKNHASNITCPIIMGVGLQDEVCPPHTNFAGYNQIKSEKAYYIYRDLGHGVGERWWKIRANFFRKELQME